MNIKLLKQIRKEILARPDQLNMYTWLDTKPVCRRVGMCGTTACIAGWAMTLSSKENIDKKLKVYSPRLTVQTWTGYKNAKRQPLFTFYRFSEEARDLLELSSNQARKLFHVDNWPKPLGVAYSTASTPEARAKVAVRAIDRFIKNKGSWGKAREGR